MAQNTFSPEKLWELNRLGGGDLSPNGKYILYTLTSYQLDKNKGNSEIYIYDLELGISRNLTKSKESEFEVKWTKDNEITFLSSIQDEVQLFKLSPTSSTITQLSNIKGGIGGYVISPSENRICTLQEVKVKKTTLDIHPDLPEAEARIENDLMYRHWNQWNDEFSTHLFIYDFDKTGVIGSGFDALDGTSFEGIVPPFSGSETIGFSQDGKYLFYSAKKKLGKEFALTTNSDIYRFDVESKQTENFTAANQGYDTGFKLSPSGNQAAWLSMKRDGFESDKNILKIFDFSTKTEKSINLSLDITINDFSWENDNSILMVVPYKGINQLFSLEISKNKLSQLTTGKRNVVHFSPGDKEIYLALQSMIEPTDLYTLNRKKGDIEQLTAVNEEVLKGIDLPKITERWVTTSDNQKMLTWVILPPNFDATKKYPTLLYCQGGPQSMVSQFFSYRWNMMLMASQGYIVVAPNRRGLPGFGQKWNDQISKDWGGQPIRDYLSAIDEVSKESFVDKDKLGAVGASYGGYSVYFLAGNHENRFKTFISHCGLFNLESWYGTTEELFFANWDIGGPYWEEKNKQLYVDNSPHKFVKNWNTPILVMHGGMDFRVPEEQGMQAFQAAQLLGLKSRYLYFPKEGHWVQKPQNGVLWQREFFKWLDEDLK